MIPPLPIEWKKGAHEDHDVIVMEVLLRRDKQGRVYSAHQLQDNEDQTIALTWPSGGLEQAAFGLLVEASRREAILDILLQMQQDPSFIRNWVNASEQERTESAHRMAQALEASMRQTIGRLALPVILDAMALLTPKE